MTYLLTELEALLRRCDDMEHSLVHAEGTKLFAASIAGTLAPLIAAEKARGPRQMSCPTCEAVRPCVESRQMMCSMCCHTFQTPAQLDDDLDAVRKARGMPAVEHEPPIPDPLLVQAREALIEAVDVICRLCCRLNPQHKAGYERGDCVCDDTDSFRAVITALDARLGRKP